MRIACAQFSPQVGDIDNNLNRADSVLNKAKPEQLDGLDLLVLPELAFTGKYCIVVRTYLCIDGTRKGMVEQTTIFVPYCEFDAISLDSS